MPRYATASPPDEVAQELIRAILEDAEQHLELRLNAIEKDFRARLRETRDYMNRRTTERVKELIPGDQELELRRKKKQPVIVDWRVPGGEFPPGIEREAQKTS